MKRKSERHVNEFSGYEFLANKEYAVDSKHNQKRKQDEGYELALSEQIKRFRITNTPGEIR
jgi:hypothetical protein